MKYTQFQSSVFQQNVRNALESVAKILDTNRKPRLAEEVDHQYDDKYALAEVLTNTHIVAQMNVLERMGLSEDKLGRLYDTVNEDRRSVTICFQAQHSCTFEKEQMVDVVQRDLEYQVETETSTTSFLTNKSKKKLTTKLKVVEKVPEYHWNISHTYRIFCYAGNDPDKNAVEICSRTASTTITTTGSKGAPYPELTIHDSYSADLTWMLRNIKYSKKQQRVCAFKIDRSRESCRTPRRNDDIEGAFKFFNSLSQWLSHVSSYLIHRIENDVLQSHRPANPDGTAKQGARLAKVMSSAEFITSTELFCPIAPLMEQRQEIAGTATRQEIPRSMLVLPSASTIAPLLSLGVIDMLLNEQCRTLDKSTDILAARFPSSEVMKLITLAEANLVLYSLASKSLQSQYIQSIEYIEEMLRKQLIAAIGKEVHQKDFHEFMTFHCNKFMAPQYAPKPFSFAIRRDNHSPEGILSIEATNIGDTIQPIHTHVRHIPGDNAPSISIPINAATSIEMTGHRFLHGWINHRFSSSSKEATYTLSARARQFSSFILMVGTVAGADKFVPQNAIILQNKDEVLIPLLLNELPTAKEFKDAIGSLSPEQQRFATAFRGMQLESSVFGICIIQLKPQLEALLDLPPGGLTKEIRLTQDLMSLFVEYQIPSDLLSFDGDIDASLATKIDDVKEHTHAVLHVIEEAKKLDLEEMARLASHNEKSLKAKAEMLASTRVDNELVAEFSSMAMPAQRRMSSSSSSSSSFSPLRSVGADQPDDSARNMSRRERYRMECDRRSMERDRRSMECDRRSMECDPEMELLSEKEAPPQTHSSIPPISGSDSTTNQIGNDLQQQGGVIDFSQIPKQLDVLVEKNYAKEDNYSGALRATIIKTSPHWKRWRQQNLLSKLKESKLQERDQKSETSKAFDLLDAITRSGALPIPFGELHVVVGITHCFENDVMGTVLQDNINPIEKVEKSILLVASSIQGESLAPSDLIAAEGPHSERLLESLVSGDLLPQLQSST